MDAEHPSSPSPEPPRKRLGSFARSFALATELPFVLIGAVLIAGGLGYLLDSWMHTSPLWMLLFGLGGFLGGIREVLRRLKQEEKRDAGK